MARQYKIGDRTFSDYVTYRKAFYPNPTPAQLLDWETDEALMRILDRLEPGDDDDDSEVLGLDDIQQDADAHTTPN